MNLQTDSTGLPNPGARYGMEVRWLRPIYKSKVSGNEDSSYKSLLLYYMAQGNKTFSEPLWDSILQ